MRSRICPICEKEKSYNSTHCWRCEFVRRKAALTSSNRKFNAERDIPLIKNWYKKHPNYNFNEL